MKKVLSAIAATSILAVPMLALAALPTQLPTAFTSVTGLVTKISTIGNYIFVILLAVAGIFLVIAGFFWLTAGGNPEQVNKARQMLVNALIGVAVALLAKGLVILVYNIIK